MKNKASLSSDSNRIKTTNVGLYNYGKRKSVWVHEISELIDNSLDSWDSKLKRKGKLIVEIVFDLEVDQIIVKDNAAGFYMSDCSRIMTMGGKSKRKYSEHGVGLKNAALWIGKDLELETNNGEEKPFGISFKLSDKLDDQNSEYEEPRFEGPYETTRTERGTVVTISSLNNDLSKQEFGELKRGLGIKYGRLLRGKNPPLAILLEYKGQSDQVQETEPPLQYVPAERLEIFRKQLERAYAVLPTPHLVDFKALAIEKASRNEPLIFRDIKIDLVKGNTTRSLTFTFGILEKTSKNFKIYKGIYAFQHDRAIKFPPDSFEFSKDYTRSDIKRAFGWVDMDSDWKTDWHKTGFQMGDWEGIWKTEINRITQDIAPLCTAIKDTLGAHLSHSVPITNSLSDQVEIEALMGDTTNEGVIKPTADGAAGQFEFSLDGEKGKQIKFRIIQKEKLIDQASRRLPIKIGSDKNDDGSETVEITCDINHPMWRTIFEKLKASRDEGKALLYPLVGVIGVSNYIIQSGIRSGGKSGQGELNRLALNQIDQIYSAVSKAIQKQN